MLRHRTPTGEIIKVPHEVVRSVRDQAAPEMTLSNYFERSKKTEHNNHMALAGTERFSSNQRCTEQH